jgi:4a-hydroxytetrahydrobiopterin dehydratase
MDLHPKRTLLTEDQIAIGLAKLDGWSRAGSEIRKSWKFKDFVVAMEFVNAVAAHAEKLDHHPDINIRWNKVDLTLSTHSAGGLTSLDFTLAETIDKI